MQNLPEPYKPATPMRNSKDNDVFAFAIGYIYAILAGKIKVEAACDILHRRFPLTGFDKAKAEHVAWRRARDKRRAEKSVIITEI